MWYVSCPFFFTLDALLIATTGRRKGYRKLRSRVHIRSTSRFIRRGTYALIDNATTVRGLVLQPTSRGSRRCWWKCQGHILYEVMKGIFGKRERRKSESVRKSKPESGCSYKLSITFGETFCLFYTFIGRIVSSLRGAYMETAFR